MIQETGNGTAEKAVEKQPTAPKKPKAQKPKGGVKKTRKAKPPKFNERREIEDRSDRLIELAPKIRKAEDNLLDMAQAHKDAKARLDTIQSEAAAIIYEMAAIRNGTYQQTLPLAPGDEKKPSTPAGPLGDIPDDLMADALRFVEARRKDKKGLTVGSLCLKLFSQKGKDLMPRAQQIIDKLIADGLLVPAETKGDKGKGAYWPADPKEPKEPVTVTSANKKEVLVGFLP